MPRRYHQYGYLNGVAIVPPNGYKLVPQGHEIPHRHRVLVWDGKERYTWAAERSCRSTMTPVWARVSGWDIAFACLESETTSVKFPNWMDFEKIELNCNF